MINICGDYKHPPFEFINEYGEVEGFNVEITSAIAKELGLEIHITLLDWTEAIRGIDNKEYHGIQGMSISGNRQSLYVFGCEYHTVFHSAIALKSKKEIKNFINIEKYKIAVQENDVAYEIVMNKLVKNRPCSVFLVSNQEDALKLLIDKKVDLVIGNKLTLLYYADQLGIEDLIKLVGNPLNLTKYGLAFHQDYADMALLFKDGLEKIKNNGKYEEIYNKWFGQNIGFFGKQIIDRVETGVIYIDKFGKITAINSFAEKVLNIKAKEFLFKSFYETEIASIFNTHIIQLILDGYKNAYYGKIENEFGSITRCLEVNYAKFLDNENQLMGVLVNFTDITEKLRYEKSLAQKDKMESLGFMLLNIAHELRNPLTSIKNFIELIPDHIDDAEFRNALIYHVPNQINYINNLFTDLLEYSKPKEARIEEVRIKSVLQNELISSISKLIDNHKDIVIENNVQDDFMIAADINQIKQVLINLFVNAIDAIESIGMIKVYSFEDDEEKILYIEDNGKSISESLIDKVFDPFFTTKEKGTGLGLFVCYNLMKENNGTIEMARTEQGTKVSLIFSKR